MTNSETQSEIFAPPCDLNDEICIFLFHSVAGQDGSLRRYSGEDKASLSETSDTILGLLRRLEHGRLEARSILQGSKNKVYKKWKGLRREQRVAFLLKHCPDLQYDQFFYEAVAGKFSAHTIRSKENSFLLNQFSLDDLKNDYTSFLALIHNRTEFGSEAWLPFDHTGLGRYWQAGVLTCPFSTKCVVVRGSEYGTIIPWDAKRIHRQDVLPVHHMLLVLKLQDQVLTLVTNALLELTETSVPSGKSHLWDQFLCRKSDSTLNDDVQFPLVHAFSLSPLTSIRTIITLIRTHSEAHEDTLIDLQSDLPFFLGRVKVPREQETVWKRLRTAAEIRAEKQCCAEILALLPEFEARIFWHLMLELFEKLSDFLGSDQEDALHEEYENVAQEVDASIQILLRRNLMTMKIRFLSSGVVERRLKALLTRLRKKRTFPEPQTPRQKLEPDDVCSRPLSSLCRQFTQLELLEEDWFLWCIDQVAEGLACDLHMLRRLLRYLQANPELAEELPTELIATLEEVCVLWKARELLLYSLPRAALHEMDSSADRNDCLMLWHAMTGSYMPEPALLGGELEKKGSSLRVARARSRRDKDWLARSDASYAQFREVTRSAVEIYVEFLSTSEYKTKSINREQLRALLLLHDSDGLTPISVAQRKKLSGIGTATHQGPAGVPRPGLTPALTIGYIPPPQEPEEKFQKSKATRTKRHDEISNLRKLRLDTRTKSRRGQSSGTSSPSEDAPPIDLSARAFRIAQQLFPAAGPRQGNTTFSDIQVFMAHAGFCCKQLPGAARLFQRLEGRGAIQGHKSITIHEPHASKYTAGQLDNLRTQMKKRFNWGTDSFAPKEST